MFWWTVLWNGKTALWACVMEHWLEESWILRICKCSEEITGKISLLLIYCTNRMMIADSTVLKGVIKKEKKTVKSDRMHLRGEQVKQFLGIAKRGPEWYYNRMYMKGVIHDMVNTCIEITRNYLLWWTISEVPTVNQHYDLLVITSSYCPISCKAGRSLTA